MPRSRSFLRARSASTSRKGLMLWAGLMSLTVWECWGRFGEMFGGTADLLQLSNVPVLFVALVLLKVVYKELRDLGRLRTMILSSERLGWGVGRVRQRRGRHVELLNEDCAEVSSNLCADHANTSRAQ